MLRVWQTAPLVIVEIWPWYLRLPHIHFRKKTLPSTLGIDFCNCHIPQQRAKPLLVPTEGSGSWRAQPLTGTGLWKLHCAHPHPGKQPRTQANSLQSRFLAASQDFLKISKGRSAAIKDMRGGEGCFSPTTSNFQRLHPKRAHGRWVVLSDSYPGGHTSGGQYPQAALVEHAHCNPNPAALHGRGIVRNITLCQAASRLSGIFLDDGREEKSKSVQDVTSWERW